ncbi:MAG: hypothetical protein PHF72_07235 [Gammaproteobacteria bacterium]|nr:hypothetical protein [Gammaproteobacteria bacterium]
MSGWGCPHEVNGRCERVGGAVCDPGMKGCVLFGRFTFSNPDKNRPEGGWTGRTPEGGRVGEEPPRRRRR